MSSNLITKDILDAKLDARLGEFLARFYCALLVQTLAIVGLIALLVLV
jgi:hypothetical protein